MNGKQYIGKRVSSFERLTDSVKYTGVALIVDDDNEYLAGDQSGNVLEVECPYGTQEMANNILTSIRGNSFKGYQAADAALDPSAELGDGVTISGIYSVLAQRTLTFGPGAFSDISAPVDTELEHEFQYKTQEQRKTERKLAQTRSMIEKSSEEIRAAIEATDGRVSELKVTLDGVTISDESGQTRIKGSSIDTGSIAAGSIRADQIQLTGAITWGDLTGDVQERVGDGLTEDIVHTLIKDDLVESPTIRGANIYGGRFWDATEKAWIDLVEDEFGRPFFQFFSSLYNRNTPVFSVFDGDGYGGAIKFKGNNILRFDGAKNWLIYPDGTWDFSSATVTGLPGVGAFAEVSQLTSGHIEFYLYIVFGGLGIYTPVFAAVMSRTYTFVASFPSRSSDYPIYGMTIRVNSGGTVDVSNIYAIYPGNVHQNAIDFTVDRVTIYAR